MTTCLGCEDGILMVERERDKDRETKRERLREGETERERRERLGRRIREETRHTLVAFDDLMLWT